MNDSSVEKALTARECGPLVGAAASSLYRGVRAGVIPCLRIGITGRSLRFIASDVRRALVSRPSWEDPASDRRGKKRLESENAE